jgi:hypothetical protein
MGGAFPHAASAISRATAGRPLIAARGTAAGRGNYSAFVNRAAHARIEPPANFGSMHAAARPVGHDRAMQPFRRGGRAVDCTGLENRQPFTGLGSSNLPLSANPSTMEKPADVQKLRERMLRRRCC